MRDQGDQKTRPASSRRQSPVMMMSGVTSDREVSAPTRPTEWQTGGKKDEKKLSGLRKINEHAMKPGVAAGARSFIEACMIISGDQERKASEMR